MTKGPDSHPHTHALIGAAIEVQRWLGTGLLESAYGDAFEIELAERSIPALREVALDITYKGKLLRTRYRADFVAGDVLIEIKASSAGLGNADLAQLWHYLAITGKPVGLLLNFGKSPIQVKRVVNGLVEALSADSAVSAAGRGISSELA